MLNFLFFRPEPSKLDYDSACLVARYLSSKRPFAQSFDIYLTQVITQDNRDNLSIIFRIFHPTICCDLSLEMSWRLMRDNSKGFHSEI